MTQDIAINFKNELSEYDRMSLKNVFTYTDAPFSGTTFSGRTGVTNVDRFTNRFHVDYSGMFKQLSLTLRYDNDFDHTRALTS